MSARLHERSLPWHLLRIGELDIMEPARAYTVEELVDRTGSTRAAVTTALQRLWHRGYIPTDRCVRPTGRGVAALNDALPELEEAAPSRITAVSADDWTLETAWREVREWLRPMTLPVCQTTRDAIRFLDEEVSP